MYHIKGLERCILYNLLRLLNDIIVFINFVSILRNNTLYLINSKNKSTMKVMKRHRYIIVYFSYFSLGKILTIIFVQFFFTNSNFVLKSAAYTLFIITEELRKTNNTKWLRFR